MTAGNWQVAVQRTAQKALTPQRLEIGLDSYGVEPWLLDNRCNERFKDRRKVASIHRTVESSVSNGAILHETSFIIKTGSGSAAELLSGRCDGGDNVISANRSEGHQGSAPA